ncbi:hypothetical protein MWH06_05350 [Wolbachia pipientis]|nr:hypothetical protein MWH06_05350 [Wolbachia pipientis]
MYLASFNSFDKFCDSSSVSREGFFSDDFISFVILSNAIAIPIAVTIGSTGAANPIAIKEFIVVDKDDKESTLTIGANTTKDTPTATLPINKPARHAISFNMKSLTR